MRLPAELGAITVELRAAWTEAANNRAGFQVVTDSPALREQAARLKTHYRG